MSLFEVEQENSIEDINLAIYNFFVRLTSVFVRPHGAEIQAPGKDGEVRLRSLYISQLDSKGIHHRFNEIKSIGAGEDVYIRSVGEDEISGLISELSGRCGLDISNCNCYSVLTQVDIYLPKGIGLAAIEAESINEQILTGVQGSYVSIENFRFLAAARSNYNDFSGTRLTKKGFDRICVTYNILLAQAASGE